MIKLSTQQFDILGSKLERAGVSLGGRRQADRAQNRVFYQILSDLGFQDFRKPGPRALAPNYAELGLSRAAGPPTDEDIAAYRRILDGATLSKNGFVTKALLFDTDLLPDRYSVATLNLLVDLYNKYLGRANDFDHQFEVTQARCRIIDLSLGADPGTTLHPDTPTESISRFTPSNPYSGTYTALIATLAFPELENDPEQVIEKVKNGLIHDISIAFSTMEGCCYCSVCLQPMSKFWFWDYCEEHGFPGGKTEDGATVVNIMDRAADAFTFGLVSDGAVKRAGIILNPNAQSDEQNSTEFSVTINWPDGSITQKLYETQTVTLPQNT